MQRQSRLRRHSRCYHSLLSTVLTGLLLTVCVSAAFAQSDPAAIASQRRANEQLQVAAAQIRQNQFAAAASTLDQCAALTDSMTGEQLADLEAYRQEASQGLAKSSSAAISIESARKFIESGNLKQAQSELDSAASAKKYLQSDALATLNTLQEQLDARRDQLKDQMKDLFSASKADFKAGRLDQAYEGFSQIQRSGVSLGFFDRGGDLTDVDGYLAQIAERRGSEPSGIPGRHGRRTGRTDRHGGPGRSQCSGNGISPGVLGHPGPHRRAVRRLRQRVS